MTDLALPFLAPDPKPIRSPRRSCPGRVAFILTLDTTGAAFTIRGRRMERFSGPGKSGTSQFHTAQRNRRAPDAQLVLRCRRSVFARYTKKLDILVSRPLTHSALLSWFDDRNSGESPEVRPVQRQHVRDSMHKHHGDQAGIVYLLPANGVLVYQSAPLRIDRRCLWQ